MSEDWQNAGFGLYIHWPFCSAKCPYCDFNSHVSADVDHRRWRAALLAELGRLAAQTQGRTLNTIFFGGGTPSLMDPETVADLIAAAQSHWQLANTAEITLEANPTSVEADKFRAFAAAGVNRVSMGIQSLRDDHLKALGRMHSVAEARAAFDIAKSHFDRVSFDLIYARQNQTLEDWRVELNEALSMSVDHLSLYQLTIEQGTRFGDLYNRGRLRDLPSDDLAADMFDATQEICEAAGMPAYEISNHAAKGSESKHNLIYWRYGDYGGIGPGAHGRLTLNGHKIATTTPLLPTNWLEQAEANGATKQAEIVSAQDQAIEYLMMSLRLAEGSDLDRYAAIAGHRLSAENIENQIEFGFLTQTGSRIIATKSGRAILNSVLQNLLD